MQNTLQGSFNLKTRHLSPLTRHHSHAETFVKSRNNHALSKGNTQSSSIHKIRQKLTQSRKQLQKTLQTTFYKHNCSQIRFYQKNNCQNNIRLMQKKKAMSLDLPLQKENLQPSTRQKNTALRGQRRRETKKKRDTQTDSQQTTQRVTQVKIKFGARALHNHCFDSTFPIARYGASLLASDGRIFLHGGYSRNGIEDYLLFHEYKASKRSWQSMPKQGELPWLSPCFHSAEVYKHYLLFIGGLSIDIKKKVRYYNTEINAYNLEKNQWVKIRWDQRIRSHASTLYGNTLVIHGGITDKEKFTDKTYYLSLNLQNISSPGSLQIHQKSDQEIGEGIAYHKMISTSDVPSYMKPQLKVEGIIRFGGVSSEGIMSNRLRVRKFASPGSSEFLGVPDTWETVYVKGMKPQPRVNHSMNLIPKKGYIVVIGGQSKYGEMFNDVWCFNLFFLHWREVDVLPSTNSLTKGISCHSTAVDNSKVFVFGSCLRMDNQKYENMWVLQTGQIKQSILNRYSKKSVPLSRISFDQVTAIKSVNS